MQRKEEYTPFPQFPAGVGDMSALLWNGLHFIVDGRGDEHLFDVTADPDEANDLAASPALAERLQWLRARLSGILDAAGAPEPSH